MKLKLTTLLFFALVAGAVSAQVHFPTQKNNSLRFTENKGQVTDMNGQSRPDVLFVAEAEGAKAYITRQGIHYMFIRRDDVQQLNAIAEGPHPAAKVSTYRLDMQWNGASAYSAIEKEGPSEDYENYYLQHCPNGITGVRSYEKVTIRNIYRDINLVLYSKNGQLEYDFDVLPGGNPSDISISYGGATSMRRMMDGSIEIATPFGSITENAPATYQDGKPVSSRFLLDKGTLRFAVEGNYSPMAKLTIDPLVKIWGTFYGGSGDEVGLRVKGDNAGNIYFGGMTFSKNNISSGGHQNSYSDSGDVILVKFNAAGVRQWATYYGGRKGDDLWDLAIDQGNIYICGFTASDTAIATSGAHKAVYANDDTLHEDGFIVKFNSSGVRQWGTYYGGKNADMVRSIACDGSGNIYVCGDTKSGTDIASGGFQNTHANTANFDGFVVKFNSSGVRQWGTYYGGTATDQLGDLALDASANIYVCGQSSSTSGISSGGFQNSHGGGVVDVFVVKFNTSGSRQWATYYGGTGLDYHKSITVDNDSNIYVSGNTLSTAAIASTNGYKTTNSGGGDAFLVKFAPGGGRLWGTYFGGTSFDNGLGVFTDKWSNIYMTGNTQSTGIASGGLQNTLSGSNDGFLAKFDSAGALKFSSYIGGDSASENVWDGWTDTSGNIYICGDTKSLNNISLNGHQNTNGGLTDAFIMEIAQPDIKITLTGMAYTTLCAGQQNLYRYEVYKNLNTGNKIYLQLSDSSGSFVNYKILDSSSRTLAGTDSFFTAIPATLPSSTNYRVRIVSTSPADTSVSGKITIRALPEPAFGVDEITKCMKNHLFYFIDATKDSIVQRTIFHGSSITTIAQRNFTFSFSQPGKYGLHILVKNVAGCSAFSKDTLQLTVLPSPTSVFPISGDTSVSPNSSENYEIPNADTAYTYSWIVTGGTITSGNGTGQISVDWGAGPVGTIKMVIMTKQGCPGDTVTINVNILATGMAERAVANGIQLYPNPANGVVYITTEKSSVAKVQCFDVLGREQKLEPITNGYSTATLSTGVYYITVTLSDGSSGVLKLVKE